MNGIDNKVLNNLQIKDKKSRPTTRVTTLSRLNSCTTIKLRLQTHNRVRTHREITTQGLQPAQPTTLCPGTSPMIGTPEEEALRGREIIIIETKPLLDTGSSPGNFISIGLLQKIDGSDSTYKTDHPMRVCSGLGNHCIDSLDVVDVLVSFKVKNKKLSIPLTCRISNSGNIDLIIGRESIKQHKLVSLLP